MATATLTDAGLNLLRSARRGLVTDIKIKYVAIGTSSTAPTTADTQLGAEAFRKVLTNSANGGSAGEGVYTLYLSPQDAVGTAIAEVGWFAGSGAGTGANTGVLVARALYSHTKTNQESINVSFDLVE